MISLFSCYQTLFHIIYLLQLLSLWLCFSSSPENLCERVCDAFQSHTLKRGHWGLFQKRHFPQYINLHTHAKIFFPLFSWYMDLHNNRMYHMFSFHSSHFLPESGARTKFSATLHNCTIFYSFICASLYDIYICREENPFEL